MITLIKNVNYIVREDNSVEFSQHLPDFFKATITPDFAKDALASSNGENRNVRKQNVARLEAAINDGSWHIGDSAAVFDINGKLKNSQHRMMACENTNKNIILLVRTRVPLEEIEIIDTNSVRSLKDAGTFAGIQITDRESAVLRATLGGGHLSQVDGYDINNPAMLKAWSYYKNYIQTAIEICDLVSKNKLPAAVVAAFVRAIYNGENVNKLARYAHYLVKDIWPEDDINTYPGDKSIVALRNHLKMVKGRNGFAFTLEVFNKAMSMLYYALNGQERDRASKKDDFNYYPIPEPARIHKSTETRLKEAIETMVRTLVDKQKLTPKMIAEFILGNNLFTVAKRNKGQEIKVVSDLISKLMKKNYNLPFKEGTIYPLPGKNINKPLSRIKIYQFIKSNTEKEKENQLVLDLSKYHK